MNNEQLFHSQACIELLRMAERELASLMSAVTKLYGAEQATLLAEVWLGELESMDGLPGSTSRDWRPVTVAALLRPAGQLTATRVSAIPSPNCFESAHLV